MQALLRIGAAALLATLIPAADPPVMPPSAAPAADAVPAGAAPLAGYRFTAGDLVRIEVYDNPDLSTTFRVPARGRVRFALIGDLPPLAGMAGEALATEITTRLADGYLRRPQVTVSVVEYAFAGVYVVGAVNKPGTVRLVPGQALTVLQAVGEAGGFTDEASRLGIQLVHDGGETERTVRSLSFAAGAEANGDVPVNPGDVVIVPRADRVYVIGKVQKPGALALPTQEPVTVSKAISLSGGFDRFARDSEVQLLRGNAAPRRIDVEAVLRGTRDVEDPVLRPGDTVYVPESRF